MYGGVVVGAVFSHEEGGKNMDRLDEIIDNFERCQCPKRYLNCCPPRKAGNDCDNWCPFIEAAEMLREYRELKNNKIVGHINYGSNIKRL